VDERAQLRSTYRDLKTEVLLRMVEVEAESFREAALDAAVDVLRERGVEPERPPPPSPAALFASAASLEALGGRHVFRALSLALVGTGWVVGSEGGILALGLFMGGTYFLAQGFDAKAKAEALYREATSLQPGRWKRAAGRLSLASTDEAALAPPEPRSRSSIRSPGRAAARAHPSSPGGLRPPFRASRSLGPTQLPPKPDDLGHAQTRGRRNPGSDSSS
jgi:hypothetical protein